MPAQTNVTCGKAAGIILPRSESIAGEYDIMIGELYSSHHGGIKGEHRASLQLAHMGSNA